MTPTAADLAQYDLVVSVGDNTYADEAAWGDALAGYVDRGGVVVDTAYNTWEDVTLGRFETGGYEPLLPGDNVNDNVELGEYDATSPLMQNVGPLTNYDNTESEAAPGATVVAKWTNGANAVAVKGHVVAISAFLGDGYEEETFTGNYGQIIFNALRTLGPPPPPPAPITPAPAPKPPPSNVITLGKLKLNKKAGTATLTVGVPDAGSLVMSGKGVKQATLTSSAGGSLKVHVKPSARRRRSCSKPARQR